MLPPGAINTGPPVVPRPSATVLLVRGDRPWELLLVQRPGGADFAPGAYVFPGGTVHGDDMGWGDEIRMAAVRETFEEVGVLLARRGGRFAGQEECDGVRSIVEGGKTFGEALRELRLEPALDHLVMFARWVTPALLRRRYDARFFLARMPADQVVRPQEGEVSDWLWITPDRALTSPDVTLVYATREVLESVASEPGSAKLFSRAAQLKEVPIVEPKMVQTESGWEIER
ncbi:MAG TPA: NUDIX hydrolase [Verrucomicrobiae bacterium]|jgi:8-oxo-dGTP pyrophosphatase MutT (NUDIX family)|nr:NUDIX hydrolase [Verrucomicrobiae bacterium]